MLKLRKSSKLLYSRNLSKKPKLSLKTPLINFRKNKFLKSLLVRASSTMTFNRFRIKHTDPRSIVYFTDRVPFILPTLVLFLNQKTHTNLTLKDLSPDYLKLKTLLFDYKLTHNISPLSTLLPTTPKLFLNSRPGHPELITDLNNINLYERPLSSENTQHLKTYALLISYLTNINTLKFKNPTKISLTRIDYESFLNNSSFFSDMGSRRFINIKQTKLFTKSKYPTYGSLGWFDDLNRLHRKSILLKNFNPLFARTPKTKLVGKFNLKKGLVKNLKLLLYKRLGTGICSTGNFTNLRNLVLKLNQTNRGNRKHLTYPPTPFSRRTKNLLRRKFRNYKFKVKLRKYNPNARTVVRLVADAVNHKTDSIGTILLRNNTDKLNLFSPHKDIFHHYTIYHYLQMLADPFFFKYKLQPNTSDNLTLKTFNKVLVPWSTNRIAGIEGLGTYNNLNPSYYFNKLITRQSFDFFSSYKFYENIIPWYYNTLIRFFEHISGHKCMFQIYPFVNQNIKQDWIARYRSWIPRMSFYERMLGHKFFMEEALHIIHLSFYYKDSKLMGSWLKAIILRISFWRTRSIFRFLKYLMLTHFYYVFADLKVKGLKIKLKGKISVAGNSRKRSILYRVGKTSHSEVSLKVTHHKTTINTFTGVMGFQIWIFY